jgi:TolB-like protein/Tfp pilus assembly protein PilF
LLYELLTGHRPYRFANRAPHEIARVICEEEPDRPSTSITREDNLLPAAASEATTLSDVCLFRGAANLARFAKRTVGRHRKNNFEITAQGTRRTLQNAAELAEDIGFYLDGKPVAAEIVSPNLAPPTPVKSSGEKSLAVLPLRVLSAASTLDTGEDFLSVGLADAMITRLSGIRRLVVRPTSAVLRFGDAEDLFVAGRELNVDFVLSGNIRRAGSRIRISAQLIDIKENSASWAQNFDADFTEVLEIEDSISERVTESLLPFLTGEEKLRLKKRGTDKPQAYESFLRGRYHFNAFTEEGFAKSIVAFHEAVAHDPNYALAFAGIADYYNWLAVFGVLPAQQCFQSAIEAATKAVELDPELSDAHAALGFAAVGGQYDWTQGEISCRRALELNPNNSTAHVWYSIQLFMEGRFEEGFRHARRGIEIDPLSPFNRHNLGWGLYFSRRFEESIEQYRLVIEQTDGQYPLGFYGLSWGLRLTDRFDEAVKVSEQALALDKESTFLLAGTGQTLAAAGKRREAEAVLAKLERLAENRSVSAYHIAVIHTFLGDAEKALAALEKSYENHEPWITWTGVEPVFDSLRGDERFINLFERTGNPLARRVNTHEPDKNAEITVESLIQTTDADGGGEAPPIKRNSEPVSTFRFPKWAIAAALLGLVCAVFFAATYDWQNVSPPDSESVYVQKNGVNPLTKKPGEAISIAVLPFVRTDAKTDDEQYLGVGTADLVTSKLGQISEINLRSANSVRRYLKSDKSPLEIGRELAVDYVVGGTIERREDAVEAKLEMTEIQSGRVVWTEIFDAPNSDLFALQDSISETVVKSLSLRLTNAEKQNLAKHFTENNKAQQLYVAGRFNSATAPPTA